MCGKKGECVCVCGDEGGGGAKRTDKVGMALSECHVEGRLKFPSFKTETAPHPSSRGCGQFDHDTEKASNPPCFPHCL